MKSRAEDPNITLRVIEKIKDKCKHYYRDTSSLQMTPLISELLNDITMLKKDCMVASELAQQYIRRLLPPLKYLFKLRFRCNEVC